MLREHLEIQFFSFDLRRIQELYLAGLAEDGGEDLADGALKQALSNVFGDVSSWKAEFAMMAASQSGTCGWIVLAWCERFKRLQNIASQIGRLALGGFVPILALDLRDHVYASDFGTDQLAYVKTYLQNIHWERVAQTLQSAQGIGSQKIEDTVSSEQVSVAELKLIMENGKVTPLVLDIRHDGDCERYT